MASQNRNKNFMQKKYRASTCHIESLYGMKEKKISCRLCMFLSKVNEGVPEGTSLMQMCD